MPPPEEEVKKGAPEWVVTFGDMMSLLLCFFVLLLSFSTMEVQKFKVVAGFVREAFGVQKQTRTSEIPAGENIIADNFNPPNFTKEVIFERIADVLNATQMNSLVEAEIVDEGVRVRVDGELVFPPGSAKVAPNAQALLDGVAKTILDTGARGIVGGHTDDRPISTAAFPSNWELSGARAGAVVRYFVSRDVPAVRLEAVGYADTKPVAPNATAEGREQNRRVELLLQPTS